eukprot:12729085-Alexandrium_andersonii.AAC.1
MGMLTQIAQLLTGAAEGSPARGLSQPGQTGTVPPQPTQPPVVHYPVMGQPVMQAPPTQWQRAGGEPAPWA